MVNSRATAWHRSRYAAVVVLASLAVAGVLAMQRESRRGMGTMSLGPASGETSSERDAFDGARSLRYLKEICDLGPRPSGSEALQRHRESASEHFRKCGAEVELQEFRVRDPLGRQSVTMVNVIARWHPERKRRIVLGAHYDTRPWPDRDPDPNQVGSPGTELEFAL